MTHHVSTHTNTTTTTILMQTRNTYAIKDQIIIYLHLNILVSILTTTEVENYGNIGNIYIYNLITDYMLITHQTKEI